MKKKKNENKNLVRSSKPNVRSARVSSPLPPIAPPPSPGSETRGSDVFPNGKPNACSGDTNTYICTYLVYEPLDYGTSCADVIQFI